MENKIFITVDHNDKVSNGAIECSVNSVIRLDVRGISYSITINGDKVVVYRHDGNAIPVELSAGNQIKF
jgi:hypothetical protein